MLKTALILDLETTGLDPAKDAIVEVGMILYSFRHHAIASATSFLVDAGLGNAAAAVNGIPAPMLIDDGEPVNEALSKIRSWMFDADVLVGHNIWTFDRMFLPEELRTRLPIVDTCHDVEWPGNVCAAAVEAGTRTRPGQSLVATALAHGLGVSHAHRALVDCELIARLLTRVHEMGHDVQAMMARAMRPKARYLSLAPFSEKDVVKAHGFSWDPASKQWSRRMAVEDAATLPFRVERGVDVEAFIRELGCRPC